MNKQEFIDNLKLLNIEILEETYQKFDKYFSMLVEWNSKFNMTSILEEKDVYLLHFYDSACLSKIKLDSYKNLCDFGTGAGFPGMVIAMLFPNINVTLIESNNKKCTFLNELKKELSLNNVEVVCSRIEEYAKNNREKFDIVTCRAVTSIPIIIELATALVKVNGVLAPLKSKCEEEIEKYSYLEKEFNLKLENILKYNLPITEAYRVIPVYRKEKITDKKYPRNYGTIAKKYK